MVGDNYTAAMTPDRSTIPRCYDEKLKWWACDFRQGASELGGSCDMPLHIPSSESPPSSPLIEPKITLGSVIVIWHNEKKKKPRNENNWPSSTSNIISPEFGPLFGKPCPTELALGGCIHSSGEENGRAMNQSSPLSPKSGTSIPCPATAALERSLHLCQEENASQNKKWKASYSPGSQLRNFDSGISARSPHRRRGMDEDETVLLAPSRPPFVVSLSPPQARRTAVCQHGHHKKVLLHSVSPDYEDEMEGDAQTPSIAHLTTKMAKM